MGLTIAFFGSSLVSAYWNGAATYYRGILAALARRGHRITFYEPDAFERQRHRDIDDPPWARVVVYPATKRGVEDALQSAAGADLLVKASGVGVEDDFLEAAVLERRRAHTLVAFWDVDAPATLDRVRHNPKDAFADLISHYDVIFTYGGGQDVIDAYRSLGAKACVPIYNALDPTTHYPVPPDGRFAARLAFLGNRLPDRERRVEEFFFRAAQELPETSFLLGGSGWESKSRPRNVHYVGHVYTHDHNAFNVTPRLILNISRNSMASYGFSPATRVFEAAGAGACLITDAWHGIETFLQPEEEILVATDGDEVVALASSVSATQAEAIGQRARRRVLSEHTYDQRALNVEAAIGTTPPRPRGTVHAEPVPPRAVDGLPSDGPSGVSVERSERPLEIVVFGLSITSSWGNGHATTYRALIRDLVDRGHHVLFLERDVPWYAAHRDMPKPPFGRIVLYDDLPTMQRRHLDAVRTADLIVVGSFVPEGVEIGRWVTRNAQGIAAFYDIDTPVTLAKLQQGEHSYIEPALIPRYDLYLSFTGGPTLDELENTYGARQALPLYCSVDATLYYPEVVEPIWDMSYMGTYSPDRQPSVEQLFITPAKRRPTSRFAVAGPQYPPSLRWPPNVEAIEHLPPSAHRRFYNASRYTLNLTRRDMIARGYSPSVRLFEAAACGVPIISDTWQGLESFFEPGQEILLCRSTEDVSCYLADMSESTRRAVGQRARERVLSAHTSAHRAQELESLVIALQKAQEPPGHRGRR